ncbi:MAG: IS66 Orf2 family protein [uncultured bacterium]|nr:MAG: IS66 Orf2 family protein [uncultured bacterium]
MFINESEIESIYLYKEAIDFRNGINGLSIFVERELEKNLFSRSLFVFINRNKSKLKVLYWDDNGFCLWQKRLEKSKYSWPIHMSSDKTIALTIQQFKWMLEGFNLRYWKPHEVLKYEKII